MVLGAAWASASCVIGVPQAPRQPPEITHRARPVPMTQVAPPFALNAAPHQGLKSIRYLPEDQMTAKDRDLVAEAESAIQKNAELEGIEFGQHKWDYEQIVCPAIPSYLLLLFRSETERGDLSLFSAAISMSNENEVRIIPILRDGFSPFTPASTNPLTISVFNRLRADEPSNKDVDWLTTGLCYAALTGAQSLPSAPAKQQTPWETTPTLQVPVRGGAIIRFSDATATHQLMEWALTFNTEGQLLAVSLSPASISAPSSAR